MNFQQWLDESTHALTKASIGTGRLDALVLLEDVTGKDRTHVLAHPETELTLEQQNKLHLLLKRRATHEPLAYVRKKTEFYGREFFINHDVLEPRPESEALIEQLKIAHERIVFQQIIDVGTGSGALAVTSKLEIPAVSVTAVDIDDKCITVARKNSKKHGTDIKFVHSNLLENIVLAPHSAVAILANLPYIPDEYHVNEAAFREPHLALFGGRDGLSLYRDMFTQLHEQENANIFVFTESLPFQHAELQNIAHAQGYHQVAEDDFIQVFSKTR